MSSVPMNDPEYQAFLQWRAASQAAAAEQAELEQFQRWKEYQQIQQQRTLRDAQYQEWERQQRLLAQQQPRRIDFSQNATDKSELWYRWGEFWRWLKNWRKRMAFTRYQRYFHQAFRQIVRQDRQQKATRQVWYLIVVVAILLIAGLNLKVSGHSWFALFALVCAIIVALVWLSAVRTVIKIAKEADDLAFKEMVKIRKAKKEAKRKATSVPKSAQAAQSTTATQTVAPAQPVAPAGSELPAMSQWLQAAQAAQTTSGATQSPAAPASPQSSKY